MNLRRRKREFMVTSRDLHFNGNEAQTLLADQWEPFGVTYVPNLPPGDPPRLRLWMRRPVKYRRRKPRVVRVQSAAWGGHQVMLHLSDGWFPMGVDTAPGAADQAIIWFVKEAP